MKEKIPVKNTEIKFVLKKWVALCSIFLIIVSGLLVYANSINGKFLWDDEIQILDNKEIRTWDNLPRIFSENIGTGAGRNYNFYRPLHVFTLMADYSLWKLDPRGWHLTNISLHILTALCVWALANLLFSNNTLSLLTALFFVVHPIHTEVVSYISGRGDSLSAFFTLLCLIFYIKRFRPAIISIFLVATCFILAILSKENALILPFLVLLYHYMFGGFKLKKFLGFIAIASIYIVLRLTILNFQAPQDQIPTTLFDRIPGFFVAMTNYVSLLILPFGLHMEHGDTLFSLSDPKALLGILITALAAICAFRSRKSNKLVTFSILWFFICLLPQSNLYRINAYMNEHWLYLPFFGFFLILSNSLCLIYKNKKLEVIAVIACAGLLSFYSFLTIKQNATYWKDPVSFYERTLQYAPFSSRICNNLARLYDASGRHEEALGLFKKAIMISPQYAEAYNNLGVAYAEDNRNTEAIDAYKKAIEIDPDFVGAYANLGNAYGKAEKRDEAVDIFQKAIKIKPDPSVYNNLAMVYRDLGKNDEAIESLKKAAEMDPGNIIIYFNLGNAYAFMGKAQEAIEAYRHVIALNPNNARAYNNIGFLLKSSGKNDEAIPLFDTAIQINPKMPEAYENLILTYLNMGENQKATEACNKAIQADPSNAKIYNKLLDTIYQSTSNARI